LLGLLLPKGSLGPRAVPESQLLGLLADHVQDGRRKRLLEAKLLEQRPRFDLRSLLN
jgi:hypothetical protein